MVSEQLIREVPLLARLHDEEISALASCLNERKVLEDSFIVHAEEPGRSMMFLVKGEAKVTLLSSQGKEIVLYSFKQGDFFGEISVFTKEDRSANVIASTDCSLLVIRADDFWNHLKSFNGLAVEIMKELALRLRAATEKIGDLALCDVYQRLARTLKSIAKANLFNDKDHLFIEARPTHQELANMIGTSREMVTRALKEMEEDGLIQLDGKSVKIYRFHTNFRQT